MCAPWAARTRVPLRPQLTLVLEGVSCRLKLRRANAALKLGAEPVFASGEKSNGSKAYDSGAHSEKDLCFPALASHKQGSLRHTTCHLP